MTEETQDKTTLFAQIREDQHEAIRIMAFQRRVSMASLVRNALDLLTEKLEPERVRKHMRDCASHPGYEHGVKNIPTLDGAAKGCDECLQALVEMIRTGKE